MPHVKLSLPLGYAIALAASACSIAAFAVANDIGAERATLVDTLLDARRDFTLPADGWRHLVDMQTGCRKQARASWRGTEIRLVVKPNGFPDCDPANIDRAAGRRRDHSVTFAVVRDRSKRGGRAVPVIDCTSLTLDGWIVRIENRARLSDGGFKCGPPPARRVSFARTIATAEARR